MKLLKFKNILIAALIMQVFLATADPISERITVTVRGQGPDVVLIPGLATSGTVWDATAKQLEGRFRLHIVQVAGFAGSPPLANATGAVMQPVMDALDAYIKKNQLKSPRIIGHSLGGLMGMMLAIQHPEDVDRLMIVDSFPFFGVLYGADTVTNVVPQAAMMRAMILNESQDAYAQGEKQFLGTLVKSPKGRMLATDWATASDKSVVARAMYEVMTTDLRPELPRIKAAVTMLYPWDASSGDTREATDKLYHDSFAALPGVKLMCIEDSYHFIMFDQPEKFAAAVETFLKP